MIKNQKEIFSNNLKKWLSIRNKTQTDIVEKFNISPSTVSDWCNAKKFPRIDKIEMLANFLNIYKSDLIEERGRTDIFGNPVVSIPILGIVKAGYDYLAQENWIGSVDVDKKLSENGELFALKVHGDSMSPILIEDDIVIIKKQDDFENGDIVVAIINGDEATIKKGKKNDNSILLQPLNTNYEPLIFTKEELLTIPVTIIGIVKQLKREF
ncbi:MAG: helix-turn-helix domain-containing protein [Clostridia bacterium]|nr:helix-turn-helix domain-containing protein [Clostridia bacterium]